MLIEEYSKKSFQAFMSSYKNFKREPQKHSSGSPPSLCVVKLYAKKNYVNFHLKQTNLRQPWWQD